MGLAAFMSQLGTDTRSSVPSGTSGGGSGGGIGGAPAMVTQLLRCAQLRFYAATGQAKHTPTDAAVRAAITIQRTYRQHQRTARAAITIQRAYRGRLAMILQRCAAITIQRAYRAYFDSFDHKIRMLRHLGLLNWDLDEPKHTPEDTVDVRASPPAVVYPLAYFVRSLPAVAVRAAIAIQRAYRQHRRAAWRAACAAITIQRAYRERLIMFHLAFMHGAEPGLKMLMHAVYDGCMKTVGAHDESTRAATLPEDDSPSLDNIDQQFFLGAYTSLMQREFSGCESALSQASRAWDLVRDDNSWNHEDVTYSLAELQLNKLLPRSRTDRSISGRCYAQALLNDIDTMTIEGNIDEEKELHELICDNAGAACVMSEEDELTVLIRVAKDSFDAIISTGLHHQFASITLEDGEESSMADQLLGDGLCDRMCGGTDLPPVPPGQRDLHQRFGLCNGEKQILLRRSDGDGYDMHGVEGTLGVGAMLPYENALEYALAFEAAFPCPPPPCKPPAQPRGPPPDDHYRPVPARPRLSLPPTKAPSKKGQKMAPAAKPITDEMKQVWEQMFLARIEKLGLLGAKARASLKSDLLVSQIKSCVDPDSWKEMEETLGKSMMQPARARHLIYAVITGVTLTPIALCCFHRVVA
jgi:hypothetical protein